MILNESIAIKKPDWVTLRGRTLDGGYELGDVLESKDSVAHLRVRVLGDSALAAYVSVYLAEGMAATEQLQVWQDLRSLKHPNLKTPLSSGRLKIGGQSAIYVVCSMPDETLAEILGDRGISEEEAKELLRCLGQGLFYLHSHGFAHGGVSPEMTVAVGDAIQLSTECTRRINAVPKLEVVAPYYIAPEVTTANVSMMADIWCLGATVFESLVQKKYENAWYGDLERLALGRTLQSCLDVNPHTRARLSELIDPPDATRPEATPVAPSARAKPVQVSRKPIGAKRIRPLDLANTDLIRFDSAENSERLKSRVKSDSGAWRPILAGVSALILMVVVIWLVILPKFQAIAQPTADDLQQPKGAWPTRTIGSPETPDPLTPAPEQVVHAASAATNWRFVIGDYKNEEDADRRIEFLNKIHPDLDVRKFSKSQAGPFYVVSGGLMSRADANELRKKALAMGIARTSYISDFSN
jgi:hypothetical protein